MRIEVENPIEATPKLAQTNHKLEYRQK